MFLLATGGDWVPGPGQIFPQILLSLPACSDSKQSGKLWNKKLPAAAHTEYGAVERVGTHPHRYKPPSKPTIFKPNKKV